MYTVHNAFWLTYILTLGRFLFTGLLFTLLLNVPYTLVLFAGSFIIADWRFYIDYINYIDSYMVENPEE